MIKRVLLAKMEVNIWLALIVFAAYTKYYIEDNGFTRFALIFGIAGAAILILELVNKSLDVYIKRLDRKIDKRRN